MLCMDGTHYNIVFFTFLQQSCPTFVLENHHNYHLKTATWTTNVAITCQFEMYAEVLEYVSDNEQRRNNTKVG